MVDRSFSGQGLSVTLYLNDLVGGCSSCSINSNSTVMSNVYCTAVFQVEPGDIISFGEVAVDLTGEIAVSTNNTKIIIETLS